MSAIAHMLNPIQAHKPRGRVVYLQGEPTVDERLIAEEETRVKYASEKERRAAYYQAHKEYQRVYKLMRRRAGLAPKVARSDRWPRTDEQRLKRNAQARAWRAANRERNRENEQRYRERHREALRQRTRNWRAAKALEPAPDGR